MKSLAFIFCFLFILTACPSQNTKKVLDTEQWRQDLRFFTEQAPKIHANLYHTLPKTTFDSIAADLDRRLNQLTDDQIRAELIKWVAAIGDGHTHLRPENTRSYPVLLFGFEEGFFVTNGSDGAENFIGWELIRINNLSISDALARLKPFQNRDNEHQIRAQAPLYLTTVEALQAAGVISNPEETVFTFRNPGTGEEKTARFSPQDSRALRQAIHGKMPATQSLYRKNQDKMYWFSWLPEQKTLYFQYNVTREDPKTPIPGFIQQMREAADKYPMEKFVVDLRWNGGGNLFTSKPFTEFIARHPKINQRGRLFVLIGRHTFSAASYFTTSLEYGTKAIFIGEPTGASPNHYGDANPLHLPNSGLTLRLSSIYWQNSFSWDRRAATEPDIAIPPRASDWFADRDAVLETVFDYQLQPEVKKTVAKGLAKKLEGRYFFQADRLLEIKESDEKWSMTIPDFIHTGLYESEQADRLIADVRSLNITLAGPEKIRLEAMGGTVTLDKAPAGFQTPGELLLSGKTEEGLVSYRNLQRSNPKARSISENALNQLGYDLMNKGNKNAALAIFQLNTEFYPEAFNTWDSLAEWYMLEGDKTRAIEYYRKSLSLNPTSENGKKMLDKLNR